MRRSRMLDLRSVMRTEVHAFPHHRYVLRMTGTATLLVARLHVDNCHVSSAVCCSA